MMTGPPLKISPDVTTAAEAMYQLATELYPICRSITGNGVRETLRRLGLHIPLKIHEVPSGTKVFDWTVPREWNIADAYVKNSAGERVIDFQKSNLHVVSYSVPVHARMPLAELKPHLFTIPEQPDAIPYRTSYYTDTWGFCLPHRQFLALPDGEYEVCVDSTLTAGRLTYAECWLPGESTDEVIVSTHICHPSLACDNLSGITVATFLAQHLLSGSHHYSYRFLFTAGAIGSITWLALNEAHLPRIRHGLVLTNLGDSGPLTYKKSRRGNTEIDQAVLNILRHSGRTYDVREFDPYGYAERQFCSPGINLPVGRLSRTPHGEFPEYHTSKDDLNFLKAASLGEALAASLAIVRALEGNRIYVNQSPKGEPQLGRRGLYRSVGGAMEARAREVALLWLLNLSDGGHSLLDISDRSGIEFDVLRDAADALVQSDLLKEASPNENATGSSPREPAR
jgi:aminopeptidase-like protein